MHDGMQSVPKTPRLLSAIGVNDDRSPTHVHREAVSLQHFVNRYIRTRRRPVNPENRLAVQEAMAEYQGHFPARCCDVEAFLDSLLLRPEAET